MKLAHEAEAERSFSKLEVLTDEGHSSCSGCEFTPDLKANGRAQCRQCPFFSIPFFKYNFLSLLIFGQAGSSLPCGFFSSCSKRGLVSCWSAPAFHRAAPLVAKHQSSGHGLR